MAEVPSVPFPSIPAPQFLWKLDGIISFRPLNQWPSVILSISPNMMSLGIGYFFTQQYLFVSPQELISGGGIEIRISARPLFFKDFPLKNE